MSKLTKAEQQAAQESLKKYISEGSMIYIIRRHTSKSGSTRGFDVYVHNADSEHLDWLTAHVAHACGFAMHRGAKNWLILRNSGHDESVQRIVQTIGDVLYGNGNSILYQVL